MSVVVVMIVRCVTVVVRMRAPVPVCATFGRERLGHLRHFCPEVLQHMADHLVLLDQQTGVFDLARCMPVADVPCQLDKVFAGDGKERFLGGDHFDQASVLKHKRVAVAQRRGVFQIDQHSFIVHGFNHFAAQKPFIIA